MRPSGSHNLFWFASLLALGAGFPVPANAGDWAPALAPLTTRWARQVSPERARPDYPRPQFVRKDWLNLNGLWEFAFDDGNEGLSQEWTSGKALPMTILVPWTFEAALSGIGKGAEIHEHVWYRRTFEVPAAWKGKNLLLHFGAVDWESTVWVNGHKAGEHRGGYTPFSFDITQYLKAGGTQEIVVAVSDPADPKKGAYQPKGKQLGSQGIWYTRTTGIWQTVWLEPVRSAHLDLDDVRLTGDLASGSVTGLFDLHFRGIVRLRGVVSLEGKELTQGEIEVLAPNRAALSIAVKNPKPWTPESPTLYDVAWQLIQAGKVVDEVKSYTAFRSVGLANKRITLNQQPYFLRGVLDQGFWPDGIYTPPTDGAIKYDIDTAKAFGLNLARKHVKVEDPRWYYYCDKLGLLVAQDMPSSHNLRSAEAKANFEKEWEQVIQSVRNHPSVILWIPFNENWGEPGEFQDRIVDLTHQLDPSRPVIDASGWTQRGKTDITDVHDYGNDLKRHARAEVSRPTWIGEYGGVALPIAGHTWVKGWGYQTVKTPQELLAKYKFLTDQINGAPGLSGFVYTQLTDVEQELNGLMTYDRIPKAAPGEFAAINRRERSAPGK